MGEQSALEHKDKTAVRDTEVLKAADRLLADAYTPREIQVPANDLSRFGIDRDSHDDATKPVLYTQYPNGVRITRFESKGLLKPGQNLELEAPPGGTIVEQKDGSRQVKDASGKVIAKLDNEKRLQVYTTHGTFTETNDGKVTFKSKDGTSDWQSLHKSGTVTSDKFEDYGLSANGTTTRFPNGIDYDRGTNKIKIPLEHFLHSTDKEVDEKGNVKRVTVYGSDHKILYWQDLKGIHVPAADGTFTQTPDGKVTFERNKATKDVEQSKPLPEKVTTKKESDAKVPKWAEGVPLWGMTPEELGIKK